MIRKFSVTHPSSHPSAGSASVSPTPTTSTIASPTSQLESHSRDGSKNLYAQSLESTEHSGSHVPALSSGVDLRLYPVGSEHDISSDEGLSMSETEDEMVPEHSELNKLMNDLDIDLRLKSAAQRGETLLIKELLNNGAQVIADESGSTAIHVAAQNGFAEVARLLLEHGTDVDLPDSNGYTALHKAAGQGHLDVLELLINEGCDIDTQDDLYGNTPLHEAAWCGYSKSVDLLLKNKSNAFITNRAGCTPLHLAAQNGHNQSGRTLLYGGCSPDVKNNYGDTPLHTAARYGHAGIARILISARCSIEEQNKNGDTALHITAAFKRRKIAKLLIEGGIGHLVRNKQDETAVDIAQRKGHTDIIDIIFQTHKQPMYSDTHQHDNVHCTTFNKVEQPVEKEAKKKSHNAFVSWIRRKFSKKSSQSSKQTQAKEGFAEEEDKLSPNNQYIKKPGFAYYRDLAGNIRQGPCGFVPAAHTKAEAPGLLEESPLPNKELDYTDAKERQRQMARQRREMDAKESMFRGRNGTTGNYAEIMGKKLHHLNKAEKDQLEINRQLAQVKNDFQELKGDLNAWLSMQAEDGGMISEEDPFAYAIGRSQARFGDDFDHERMARYDVSEQFPPPPRLFRCRSDETLSHSEYSYHGRAFKSREAAMEELKTLKHHEELRAMRRRIRAAGDEQGKTTHEHDSYHPQLRSDTPIIDSHSRKQTMRHHTSRPSLWQSRENIRQKDIVSQRDREVFDNHTIRKSATDNAKENPATDYNWQAGQHQREPETVLNESATRYEFGSSNHKKSPSCQQTASKFGKNSATLIQHDRKPSSNRYGSVPKIYTDDMPESRQRCDLNSARNHENLTRRQLVKEPSTRQASNLPATNRQYDNRQTHSLSARQPENPVETPKTRFAEANGTPVPSSQNDVKSQSYLYSESSRSSAPAAPRSHLQQQTSSRQVSPARLPLPTYQQAKATQSPATPLNGNPSTRPAVQQADVASAEVSRDSNFALASSQHTPLPTESCCASSNPDSGYGGQNYDFYTSQPTQATSSSQTNKDYEGWYSRRLQDAARRINVYSGLRPKRTMTSDV